MPNLIVFPRKGQSAEPEGDAERMCAGLLENLEQIQRNLRVIIDSCADGPSKDFLEAQQRLLTGHLEWAASAVEKAVRSPDGNREIDLHQNGQGFAGIIGRGLAAIRRI